MKQQKQAFVIGENISHSKSPLIHNYWLTQKGINGHYAIKDLSAEKLPDFINHVRANEYITGFNVTIPYKQNVIAYLDEVEGVAQNIGAVNTVYKKGEKLIGTNTDAYGFMANLKAHLGDGLESLKSEPVLLYGAGGAAKAIFYGLIEGGFQKIDISNRTAAKASELANPYENKAEIKIIDGLVKNVAEGYALFINTTSLGMKGHDNLDIDLDSATDLKAVIDIVYTPLYTDILRNAQKADIQIVTGIGMLLHQAVPAFEKFFGPRPEIDKELENLVLGL